MQHAWPASATVIDSRRLLWGISAMVAGVFILGRLNSISRSTNTSDANGAAADLGGAFGII